MNPKWTQTKLNRNSTPDPTFCLQNKSLFFQDVLDWDQHFLSVRAPSRLFGSTWIWFLSIAATNRRRSVFNLWMNDQLFMVLKESPSVERQVKFILILRPTGGKDLDSSRTSCLGWKLLNMEFGLKVLELQLMVGSAVEHLQLLLVIQPGIMKLVSMETDPGSAGMDHLMCFHRNVLHCWFLRTNLCLNLTDVSSSKHWKHRTEPLRTTWEVLRSWEERWWDVCCLAFCRYGSRRSQALRSITESGELQD